MGLDNPKLLDKITSHCLSNGGNLRNYIIKHHSVSE